ncbi:phytanoyl-CoA dioxygenase family protein [Nocardia sp. NBC_00565]|uniref:phytanoyl-CoA dioxygenase family protein n=1 Tax=Nocardia sp. NBC_00565 TaxID=2975993 RepID=UPI002E824B9B|nr:phytanoyl-CoA dioxygenase family protein [Nocardia sp. NBC_00565]WUC06350.1 phytanoyl-CoA dioxygenase family protein [Nocardia sp. NBC_00565]
MTGTETSTSVALRHVAPTTSVSEILEIVDADGAVIIEGFLSPDQVRRVNAEIDPALEKLGAGSKHDDEFTADFHGAQTKRLTNLITLSETFRNEIIDHDLLHALGEAVYRVESGDHWMTTAQVIEIGPGNKAQLLHRDLENNHFAIGMGKTGPMVMVNFLIALTDFTEENGATRIIPGSNQWDDYEDRGTPEMTIAAEMKAGDVIFFNGKVSHGGGANVTDSEYRRGLTIPLQPAFLTPEEAYPFLLDLELVKTLSPRVQKLIGFRSLYPKGSPGLWQSNYEDISDLLGL